MPAHLKLTITCVATVLLAAVVVRGQEQADAPSPAEALMQAAKASLADGKYEEAEAAFRPVASQVGCNHARYSRLCIHNYTLKRS